MAAKPLPHPTGGPRSRARPVAGRPVANSPKRRRGQSYPAELRLRVVRAVQAGEPRRDIALRFGLSPSTVGKWMRQFRKSGRLAAKPAGGDYRDRLQGERVWLLRWVLATPELTLARLHQELSSRGVKVGIVTLRRFLKQEKINLKRP